MLGISEAESAHLRYQIGTSSRWGGVDYDRRLSTGGRYNPTTDSWTATSTGANAPSRRYYQTAVWTGTEMIVWGGYNPDDINLYLYCATGCVVPTTIWRDLDADGYGDLAQPAESLTCAAPAGFVANADDCDDANSAIHPGGAEVCNAIDDDCDALCSDKNACTTVDACTSGVCVRGLANLDATDFSSNRVDGRDLVVLADAWNSCPSGAQQ